jgi:hypothetical protein
VNARTAAHRLSGGRPGRLRAALCLLGGLLGLALFVSPARAAVGVQCKVERAGERALVSVTLADVLDPDLRRLVELGLAGRLRVEVTLHRRRAFWFDAQVGEDVRQSVLQWSRQRSSMLLDGQVVDASRLTLPFVLRPGRGGLQEDEHHVDVAVRLEVVTASSLGAVARWLAAGRPGANSRRQGNDVDEDEVATPILPRALAGALAADLARTARGRCTLPVRRR